MPPKFDHGLHRGSSDQAGLLPNYYPGVWQAGGPDREASPWHDPTSAPASQRHARPRAGRRPQLAQRTHFSVQLVSAVEQGRKPASHAFATAAARALQADPQWLLGQDRVHRQHDFEQPGPVGELRAVIDAWDDPDIRAPLDGLDVLAQRVAAGERLRHRGRYDELDSVLPPLLRQLYAHAADTSRGTELSEQVAALLADGYSLLHAAANRYGLVDVVAQAVDRHLDAAERSGDPLRPAVAAYRRTNHQMRFGNFTAALRALQRAERGIADVSGPAADSVRVQLALRQSVVAARLGDRNLADELVTDARGRVRARRLPIAPYPNVIASRLNADMHGMTAAMEAQDGTTALERAREVKLPGSHPDRPRVAHWHLDLARAWLLHGDRGRTVAALNTARRAAPQHVRYHPSLHETIATLAAQDARRTDSLAGLARWAGIRL